MNPSFKGPCSHYECGPARCSRPAYVIHDEAADTYEMKTTTYRTFILFAFAAGLLVGLAITGIALVLVAS